MKYFLMFIIFYATTSCLSQNLSVELSIVWENEKNNINISNLKGQDSILVPYLYITYRNNGSSDIYFKKLFSDTICPPFIHSYLYHDKNFLESGNPTIGLWNFSAQEIFTIISNDSYLYYTWNVLDETDKKAIELDEPIVTPTTYEMALGNIYSLLSLQELLDKQNSGKQLIFFTHPQKEKISYREALELTKEEINGFLIKKDFNKESIEVYDILKVFKDYFIFLKKEETYVQRKNLIGFEIIKGNFNFSISDNIMSNKIKVNIDKGVPKEFILPKEINNYKLYTGEFNTNNVGVKF